MLLVTCASGNLSSVCRSLKVQTRYCNFLGTFYLNYKHAISSLSFFPVANGTAYSGISRKENYMYPNVRNVQGNLHTNSTCPCFKCFRILGLYKVSFVYLPSNYDSEYDVVMILFY